MKQVYFYYADVILNIPNKKALRNFIATIFKKEKVLLQRLNYVFCSDEYLLKINRDFLNHDYYTDIITFNLSENKYLEGEIYISVERTKQNSLKLGVPFEKEILRVLFHGVLHLCGYNDKNKSDILKIRRKEDHYIELYQKA